MALHPPARAWTFRRAGSIDANPTTFAQKSAAFAASATTQFNSVTLLATRDDDGVHGYLVANERQGMDAAALNLAHAVGSRVERVDTPPELTGPGREVVGRLHFVQGQSGKRSPPSSAPKRPAPRLGLGIGIGHRLGLGLVAVQIDRHEVGD